MVPESVRNRPAVGRNPEAVAIGSLFVTLFAAQVWTRLVAAVGYRRLGEFVTPFESNLVHVFVFPSFLVYVVGFALAALAYARVRNVEIPFGLPVAGSRKTAVSTLLAAPLMVALAGLAGHLVLDTSVGAMAQTRYAPDVRLSFVVLSSFVPAIFEGLGVGLLFFGVVHERLRAVTTPRHALVLTPAVVGFFWEIHGEAQSELLEPMALVHFALLVLVGVAFGSSVGLLYRGSVRDSAGRLVRAAYVPVFTVGLLGVFGVISGLDFPADGIDLLRLAAFGLAAYGYERTRSIWVPVLVVATFLAAVDAAVFVEAVAGLGAPV